MAGEHSPSLRRLVKIRMKQINVFPMLILLIVVIALVIWLKP
jgi:hypothetical protein